MLKRIIEGATKGVKRNFAKYRSIGFVIYLTILASLFCYYQYHLIPRFVLGLLISCGGFYIACFHRQLSVEQYTIEKPEAKKIPWYLPVLHIFFGIIIAIGGLFFALEIIGF